MKRLSSGLQAFDEVATGATVKCTGLGLRQIESFLRRAEAALGDCGM